MSKAYGRIANVADLKALHEEAKANGKLEVGLSKGNILYAWDPERNNLRTITTEEAAQRLGLTIKQVDQIITTGCEIDFEEIIPELAEEPAVEEHLYVLEPIGGVETPAEEPEDLPGPFIPDEPEEAPVTEPVTVEEPVNEPEMWKRIEDMISELVDDRLNEYKQQLLDGAAKAVTEALAAIVEKVLAVIEDVRDELK
jgi:hypothetical protein